MSELRDTYVEIENMAPGEYYLFVEVDWPEKSEHTEFCASFYGASGAYFLRDESSQFSKEEFLS
jgi:hypothetical protein